VVVAIEPWEERRQSGHSAELKKRCQTPPADSFCLRAAVSFALARPALGAQIAASPFSGLIPRAATLSPLRFLKRNS